MMSCGWNRCSTERSVAESVASVVSSFPGFSITTQRGTLRRAFCVLRDCGHQLTAVRTTLMSSTPPIMSCVRLTG